MRFDINYYYSQKFLSTKKCRKERKRQIKNVVSVNCTEPTAEQFQVAFIVHDMQSVQDGMTSYDDYKSEECVFRMFDEEIRTYEGKLYSPIRVTHGAAISTVFEDEKYVICNLERIGDKDFGFGNDDEFSEESIVVGDNRAEVEQAIIYAAENYIYFEGKFWRGCGEPRYVINTFGLGHNHGGTGMFIEYWYNDNIPNSNYFNALQREAAISYGKSIAAGRGDTESVDGIGEYDNIEVCMPEMVKVDPVAQHGKGDKFMNMMEEMIKSSSDANEAGLLCVAMLCSPIV